MNVRELKQSSPKTPDTPVLLGGSQRGPESEQRTDASNGVIAGS